MVFRDGVGDGQLEATERHEATQFVRAFSHAHAHDHAHGHAEKDKDKHGGVSGVGEGKGPTSRRDFLTFLT